MATAASARTSSDTQVGDLLRQVIAPDRVLTRPIELIAFASDASFYRLIPQAVVITRSVEEVQALFRFSHQRRIPLTFRTAGTSLSGQAVTDGVLVEVARHWTTVKAEDGGRKVRVQPGVIGGRVNLALRPYRAKIGPDPASIDTCRMGGILSNNSSGMCCGVENNAYHTLHSMTFVLPSGTVMDTADTRADEMFHQREPRLASGILDLKARIEASPALADKIRAKYRTKNTTGYSLNAFLDFERAIDIFQHVLIGSEGTLAFIAEAVLNTIPDLPVKYTGLLLFADLYAACAAIVPLRDAGAKALEIMDRASLRSVENQQGVPESIKRLPDGAAGLLVEFQAADVQQRHELEASAEQAVGALALLEAPLFTHEPAQQALLWKIRAGMFPSVGAVRKSGTTVIIEDVAFPIEHLADATLDLTKLFTKHGYDNGIIFGHAKDGNLHFVITQSFNDQAAIDQYARFLDDMVHLVVDRYQGALKAEHGTGRNMAPFVEAEWGREAYAIMRRLKELVDPNNLLNPGVIINPDPQAHLAALKAMPSVEEEVDKCIECGYCEPKCPSRELTLTPRQRIVVRREMVRLGQNGNSILRDLERDFPYMALDTCAADGLCATACPVAIDTGQLTKRFRRLQHSASANAWAMRMARHFKLTEIFARFALDAGHLGQSLLGDQTMVRLTRWLRKYLETPVWLEEMPETADREFPATSAVDADAVYFPSCISRVMGKLAGEPPSPSLMQTMLTLGQRAGLSLFIPDNVAGNCCGVPFSSKGYDQAHDFIVNRTIEKFWGWSKGGALPIVIDTSPCSYGLLTSRPHLTPENQKRFDRMRILDSVMFAHGTLLPRLTITRKKDAVALHPVCSLRKMNLGPQLEDVARACAEKVTVPAEAGCCAFAGDRGFLFPELTASATRAEAAELSAANFDGCYSSSRTCEIGMARATARPWRSFLHLLEESTRPRNTD